MLASHCSKSFGELIYCNYFFYTTYILILFIPGILFLSSRWNIFYSCAGCQNVFSTCRSRLTTLTSEQQVLQPILWLGRDGYWKVRSGVWPTQTPDLISIEAVGQIWTLRWCSAFCLHCKQFLMRVPPHGSVAEFVDRPCRGRSEVLLDAVAFWSSPGLFLLLTYVPLTCYVNRYLKKKASFWNV